MRALGALIGMAALAVSVTGCSLFHPHASQQAQAPPLQTGHGAIEQQEQKEHQPPPPSSPPQPVAQTSVPPLPPVQQPKVKHPRKAKRANKNQPPAETQQRASAAPASPAATPASPIGQLTTGDSATQAETKHNTLTLIDSTEQGLSEIKRSLSSEEQAIVAQIRTFLKQAKQALATGDSDGALTLATKAKLLLDELTKH